MCLLGSSPCHRSLCVLRLRGVAETDLAVLILGENGTRRRSRRPDDPLSQCPPRRTVSGGELRAALTESLLESELFGHGKGAFTDAREEPRSASSGPRQRRHRCFSTRSSADLSLGGQAKLLRVLEEKVVVRVGGSEADSHRCSPRRRRHQSESQRNGPPEKVPASGSVLPFERGLDLAAAAPRSARRISCSWPNIFYMTLPSGHVVKRPFFPPRRRRNWYRTWPENVRRVVERYGAVGVHLAPERTESNRKTWRSSSRPAARRRPRCPTTACRCRRSGPTNFEKGYTHESDRTLGREHERRRGPPRVASLEPATARCGNSACRRRRGLSGRAR